MNVKELSSLTGSHIGLKIWFEFLHYGFANKVACYRILFDSLQNSASLSQFCVNAVNQCSVNDLFHRGHWWFFIIIFGFYITCGLILMFLKKYLNPVIFINSKEKYLFMGGKPMWKCSIVDWLFDMVVKLLVLSDFLDDFNL